MLFLQDFHYFAWQLYMEGKGQLEKKGSDVILLYLLFGITSFLSCLDRVSFSHHTDITFEISLDSCLNVSWICENGPFVTELMTWKNIHMRTAFSRGFEIPAKRILARQHLFSLLPCYLLGGGVRSKTSRFGHSFDPYNQPCQLSSFLFPIHIQDGP